MEDTAYQDIIENFTPEQYSKSSCSADILRVRRILVRACGDWLAINSFVYAITNSSLISALR